MKRIISGMLMLSLLLLGAPMSFAQEPATTGAATATGSAEGSAATAAASGAATSGITAGTALAVGLAVATIGIVAAASSSNDGQTGHGH